MSDDRLSEVIAMFDSLCKEDQAEWNWVRHGAGWALMQGRCSAQHGLNKLTVANDGFDWGGAELRALIARLLNEHADRRRAVTPDSATLRATAPADTVGQAPWTEPSEDELYTIVAKLSAALLKRTAEASAAHARVKELETALAAQSRAKPWFDCDGVPFGVGAVLEAVEPPAGGRYKVDGIHANGRPQLSDGCWLSPSNYRIVAVADPTLTEHCPRCGALLHGEGFSAPPTVAASLPREPPPTARGREVLAMHVSVWYGAMCNVVHRRELESAHAALGTAYEAFLRGEFNEARPAVSPCEEVPE